MPLAAYQIPLTAYVQRKLPLTTYVYSGNRQKPPPLFTHKTISSTAGSIQTAADSILISLFAADSILNTADNISNKLQAVAKDLNKPNILGGQVLGKLSYLIDKILLSVRITFHWRLLFRWFIRLATSDFQLRISVMNLDIDRPATLDLAVVEIPKFLERLEAISDRLILGANVVRTQIESGS